MEPESQRADSLFRKEALERLQQEEDIREPLRVSPPWTWSLFWVMAALTAAALALAGFGTVEVQRPGKGILRPLSGVRLLQAEVAGVLTQTCFRNGDHLQAGQTVARLSAAQVQGSLLESERQLQLLRSTGQRFTAAEAQLTGSQIEAVRARIAGQEDQVKSYQASVDIQGSKLTATRRLVEAALSSRMNLEEAKDALNAAQRQRDAARQQLTQLRQELAALELQRERQAYQRVETVHGAQAKRDALDASLQQTEIRAPLSGYLEALVAKPGDLLQAGQPVAKLIPDGSPIQVVAFLAEKDRAMVNVGDLTQLELEAYPSSEFGTLRGRITRIGSDLTPPYEVKEALGEDAKLDAASFRVELEILAQRPPRLTGVALRPGMLLQARFVVRRQRIITLVLDPLRRWLE